MAENTTVMSAQTAGDMSSYKCWQCGSMVPHGVLHTCGNWPPPVPTQLPHAASPDPAQVRIADALERIATALEAQSQQKGRKMRERVRGEDAPFRYELSPTIILGADGLDEAERVRPKVLEAIESVEGVVKFEGRSWPTHRNDLDGALASSTVADDTKRESP